MSNQSPWSMVFKAQFGKPLDPGEVTVWENEFDLEFDGHLTGPEINAAIRRIAADRARDYATGKSKGTDYAPTCRSLIGAIKKMRWERSSNGHEYVIQTSAEAFVEDLKSRILAARTNTERWDLVCEPGNMVRRDGQWHKQPGGEKECAHLEAFARSHFPDFHRPSFGQAPVAELQRVTP